MSNKSEFNITGHLQIAKVYKDGTEDIVFDDHNIIVAGMGIGLSYLFSDSGSDTILDYQIDRFQVGTAGAVGFEISSTSELAGSLSSTSQYGDSGNLVLETATQIVDGVDEADKVFALIPQHKITRINENSVRYTLVMDEDACNNLTLNEAGLFMKNPTGSVGTNKSILVAYRHFTDITKADDFSLILRWTINF